MWAKMKSQRTLSLIRMTGADGQSTKQNGRDSFLQYQRQHSSMIDLPLPTNIRIQDIGPSQLVDLGMPTAPTTQVTACIVANESATRQGAWSYRLKALM